MKFIKTAVATAAAAMLFVASAPAQAQSALQDILSSGVLKVGTYRRLESNDHEGRSHQHLYRLRH